MTEQEFDKVTEELAELVENGAEIEHVCAQCPYREQCTEQELFWGCTAWEQSMGDDL